MTFVINPDGLNPVLEVQGWEKRTDPSMMSSGFHMYTMHGMCVSDKNKFKNLKNYKVLLISINPAYWFLLIQGKLCFSNFSGGLPQWAELSGRARDSSLPDGDGEGL